MVETFIAQLLINLKQMLKLVICGTVMSIIMGLWVFKVKLQH